LPARNGRRRISLRLCHLAGLAWTGGRHWRWAASGLYGRACKAFLWPLPLPSAAVVAPAIRHERAFTRSDFRAAGSAARWPDILCAPCGFGL